MNEWKKYKLGEVVQFGNGKERPKTKRKGQVLFIDARNYGYLLNRRNRALTDEDIQQIAQTYHNWKMSESGLDGLKDYQDVAGFCKSVSTAEIAALNYVVTPGRYVGLPDEEDDFNFAERFATLKTEFEKQIAEEEVLNKAIAANLAKIKY